MKKNLLLFTFLLFAFSAVYAQNRQITGKVADKSGEALIGVSVTLKGTTQGVGTDVKGNFKISVPAAGSPVLVLKYIGFKTREISVGKQTQVNVTLEEDVTMLQEAVVNIGYQTVSREALAGSVSSTSAKQIKDIPLSSAAEAITGRLAGVNVTTAEGQPGAEVTIRVRGGGSITQDNSPLYIVDGVPVENALSILSPQEIQSIDVLKDAASTAIYGARGANGVILITTKGGKEMKTQVAYNGFSGVRKIVNKLNVMKPYDFVMYQYETHNIDGNEDQSNSFRDKYGRWEDLDLYKEVPFADWQDRVFGGDAWSQTHVLTLTGGTKATTYNFTLNHTDEDGIMLESGYVRTLAAFKFDHKASEKLRVGLNTRYSRQQVDGVGTSSTGSQGTNRLRNSVRFRPFDATITSYEDEFDANYDANSNLTNPVALAHNEIKNDYRNDINFTGYAEYKIVKDLTFKSTVGITATDRKTDVFNGTLTSVARQNNNQPVVDINNGQGFTLNNSNVLTYRTNINKDHKLDFLLGQEIYQTKSKEIKTNTKWLPSDITPEQAFASIQKATPPDGKIQSSPTTSEGETRLFSLFGRANYSYKGKYIGAFTIRRDGSTKFSPDNRYAVFPSAQLAWRLSEESFLKDNTPWLSNLKMRLSYGTAGNNRIGDDLYKTMFGASSDYGYAFGNSITPGFASTSLANPDLKWETTVSRNLGFDVSVLNGRFNASADFYMNSTKDLLMEARIPQTSGYETQFQNVGKTENKGIELQLDGIVMNKRDFNWSANFNIGFNRNKIVSLGAVNGVAQSYYLTESGWVNKLQDFYVGVGMPVGQFYGYVTEGFYGVDDFDFDAGTKKYTLKSGIPNSSSAALGNRAPQPGDLKLKKLTDSENMMINPEEDRTILGNALPKFTGGFNQQFTYKNFDMSVFMNFSYGNKVYNANRVEFTSGYQRYDNNQLALMGNRWQWFDASGVKVTDPVQLAAMNADTEYWSPSRGDYFLHSFAIEDGSFLRISNVTLGYSLPQSLLKRTKVFSQLRVYTTVNNLLTITGYSGYDPEANTRRKNPLTPSVDYAAYPRSRFVLAGINAKF